MRICNPISFRSIDLRPGFWLDRYDLNKHVSMENVRLRFEESARFDSLRFNYLKNARRPHIFFDSDVAKWMEAVAYLIEKDPDSMTAHRALCEELIDCMEKAQREDGYLNSTHQQLEPHLIFKDRGRHELYCAGHLIEAAVAWHKATGSDRFLKIMMRYADCIERVFVKEQSASFKTPGHEEIELALYKLYRHTGIARYRDLADHFLTLRGTSDDVGSAGVQWQDDADIYHLRSAVGHSVRALYLYSAIADMALEHGDEALLESVKAVFTDIICRKMYITGSVGSTYSGEAFTIPYDLPNRESYSESCCAIAMLLFCHRLRLLTRDPRIGDTVERILYNHLLSSTSLDGKAFFYINPLEIQTELYKTPHVNRFGAFPITERVEVFDCSCCPPNINRMMAQIGDLIAYEEENGLCIEQMIASDIHCAFGTVSLEGDYLPSGRMRIFSENYTGKLLSVRVPAWCKHLTVNGEAVTPENGYLTLSVDSSFDLSLDFHIAPRFVASNPRVRADAGCMALCYGPMVYCLEGVDNGSDLRALSFSPDAVKEALLTPDFHGFSSITLPALRDDACDALYPDADAATKSPATAKFIPYFAFANRGSTDLLVWVRRT